MQQGTITNLHIARVKETPSDPVQEAAAISGLGLEGDRSCREGNMRQVKGSQLTPHCRLA
jgi:hypothetical protein